MCWYPYAWSTVFLGSPFFSHKCFSREFFFDWCRKYDAGLMIDIYYSYYYFIIITIILSFNNTQSCLFRFGFVLFYKARYCGLSFFFISPEYRMSFQSSQRNFLTGISSFLFPLWILFSVNELTSLLFFFRNYCLCFFLNWFFSLYLPCYIFPPLSSVCVFFCYFLSVFISLKYLLCISHFVSVYNFSSLSHASTWASVYLLWIFYF